MVRTTEGAQAVSRTTQLTTHELHRLEGGAAVTPYYEEGGITLHHGDCRDAEGAQR